ncbi:MAG: hypothetical protein ACO2PL_06495 [Armatimonadota bacterium]
MAPATGRQWKGKGGQKASQRLEAGQDASPSPKLHTASTLRPHFVHISPKFVPRKRPFAPILRR